MQSMYIIAKDIIFLFRMQYKFSQGLSSITFCGV